MFSPLVTARSLQGMARVRSGQAAAWPLVSDRRGAEAPTLKRGSRRCFLRSGFRKDLRVPLDGGGAPPDTERAIPGSQPSQHLPMPGAEIRSRGATPVEFELAFTAVTEKHRNRRVHGHVRGSLALVASPPSQGSERHRLRRAPLPGRTTTSIPRGVPTTPRRRPSLSPLRPRCP